MMIKSTDIKKLELGGMFSRRIYSDRVKAKLKKDGIEFDDKGLVRFDDGIAAHLVFSNINDLKAARVIDDKFNSHTEALSLRDEQREPPPPREYGRNESLRKLVE